MTPDEPAPDGFGQWLPRPESDPAGGCRADGGRTPAGWADGFDGWAAAAKPGDTDAAYDRRFSWQHDHTQLDVDLSIPVDTYEYCLNRTRTADYGRYVADPIQEPYIASVAEDIAAATPGQSTRDTVASCVRFVQSLEYARDRADTGHEVYPKYPIETLVHERGDCEDGTLLLCTLLEALGYDTAIVVFPDHHHMVAGMQCDWASGASVTHDGTRFVAVETTISGWDVGELPPQFQGARAEIHRPTGVPLLVHQWDATPGTDGVVSVAVHAANFGTAPAENVQVEFCFERRDGAVVERARLGDGGRHLGVGESVQYTRDVVPPPDQTLRGRCRLIVAGILHDETVSEWH